MHYLPNIPLERLFQRLELSGFVISPADRLRVYRLLDGPAKEFLAEPERLRELLAPVLARSAAEQAKFYELFDQYVAEIREPLAIEAPPNRWDLPRWWRYLFGAVLLALLGYALYVFVNRPPPRTELAVFIDGPPYASVGDTVTFANRSRYAGDSSELRWQWQYYNVRADSVEQVDSLQFNWTLVVPPTSGEDWQKEIRLAVYHPEEDSLYYANQPFAIFCPNPPATNRIDGPKQTEVGSRAVFTLIAPPDILQIANVQGRKRLSGPAARWTFQWDFGDGSVDSSGTYFASHKYEQNGQYTVQLTVRDTSGNGICETTHSLDLRVGTEKAFLPPATLERDQLEPLATWGWGYYLLLGLIGLAVIYYWVRYFARRREQDQELAEDFVSPEEKALKARFSLGDRAPYFIPLRDQSEQIAVDPQQLRLADALRLRQEGYRKQIDVPATLQATIDKGGFPEVRFRYTTRPSEYLFLIDEQSRAGHLGQLFKHLVNLLREQDVYAETFHYRQHFTRFWNAYHPDGLSLEQLYNSYGDYRLVVLGDLHELIDPAAAGQPQLRATTANVIRNWSQRLLLTPVPPVSWSYREKILARLFQPFPADVDGLGEAALYLENDGELLPDGTAFDAWKRQQEAQRQDADTEHRNWRRWPAIKEYLAAYSDELVEWFQALAVFPLPSWEMTIAIGRSLGAPVTYDNLLRLARIPVLQKDTFDERLRQELLKNLDPGVEQYARQAVRAELAAVKAVAAGAHVQRELETALAIQNFALDPEAPENQDTIRFLLRNGIINKGQEAELDQVTTRHTGQDQLKKQMTTKAGKRPLPRLKVRDYLAQGTETEDKTTPAPTESVQPDLLKAIAATAAYLILLLIGWQLGGSEQLYQLAFGEKPEERLIQQPDEPLRDYFFVQEEIVVDSGVIYNNQAVADYEQGAIREAEALLQRANRARGLYVGEDGLPRGNYPLASLNFSRLQYNRAVSLLEAFLQDSIDQATMAQRFPIVQAQLATAESDSTAGDILHARGVISYYLGYPDSLLESYYQQLDSSGYFDRIDYRPNLETLMQRERSRIRDLNIREAANQGLDIQIDYYYNPERDGAKLQIVAYSEGEGRQPEPATTAAELGPGSTTLSLRPDGRTDGQATHIIVELRKGEDVVNSVRSTYPHAWRAPVQETGNGRTGSSGTDDTGKIPQQQLSQEVPFELRGRVVPDGPQQREGLASISIVVVLPENPNRRSSLTTTTDGSGNFVIKGSLDASERASYKLTATDPEGRYATTTQTFEAAPLEKLGIENITVTMQPTAAQPPYLEPEMVRVNGGTFTMGCIPERDGECNEDELPAHEVTVSSFSIGKYEVTNAEFVLFLRAEGNQEEGGVAWVDFDQNFIQASGEDFAVASGYEQHPVAGVNWYAARAYANWLSEQTGRSYRLPTEAEWEYAARGGQRGQKENFRYSGSNDLAEVAWYNENSKGSTQPVGQLRPNQVGTYDMSGNVREWCSDGYDGYSAEAQTNPRGPERAEFRVQRGGSWFYIPRYCRSADRFNWRPDVRYRSNGFRLAAPVQ